MMRKLLGRKAVCLLLIISLFVGLVPTTAFAGWDDGTECEFCGGYRFDDWLCDDGPHCSENADGDCYYENHCAECLGPVENSERCDTCYICPDCMSDGAVLHCALCGACDEGGYDVCEDCDLCMNCQIEAGTHCIDCGDCLESGSQCPDHPFEMYQENHCESCALKCSGCEDKCFLGEIFIDIYCEEHELCVVCATDDGLHCKECFGCYEDELCSDCQLCDECGLESGNHCPECDAHGDDWCDIGGEGTHCAECASEYLCEQCEVCTSCSGTEFCDECGLCTECCRENAESENCSCGEYCIESANWEEHFCADCGTCFDENEQCETCEYCVECCASQSECGDGMCVEDTDYDEHFCEECQSCFHEVEACESCQDAGVSLCAECCASLTEDQGCSHEYCTNSWQWDEHYCDLCRKCYGDVDCIHDATAHIHTYDSNGNCTVCGYNKDGKPVITKQPKSVTANPGDAAAVYTVEAIGDNLTYQWYYISLSTGEPVAMTEGTAYKGTTINEVSFTVETGMCSLGKPVQIYCVVENSNGNVTTNTVDFLVAHQYGKYQKDETHHWYVCENCGKEKDKAEHRFNAWTIVKQASQTENGRKLRKCYDCNYTDSVIIPLLPADHVHDYSAAYVKTDMFHWTKCACGSENKSAMEEHDFGNGWVTTIQPTLTSVGEETRTCSTCGYVETKEIEKQGHTHEFYNEEYLENHKDNGNYGYLLHNGYIVNLYSEPYGKKNSTYHYAYCVVDGCDAYERYTHKWYTEWYDLPTETIDGSYEKKCSDCFYTTGLKSSPAGKYRVITKNCTTNIQAAASGSTVKISLYKDYPAGYFVNFNENDPNACIDVNYTWGNGASGTWKMIEEEYHEPDEKNPNGYWTFIMPELPDGSDWMNFYVEVEVEYIDCSEDNHGDGRGFEWTDVKEATCGQPGYTGDYKCKWCNYIEERGHDIPATGEHGELIAEEDYPGDCDHAGYTGAKRCSVCDEIIVPRDYHGKTHKVIKDKSTYVAATCTSKGQSSQYVCGECGIVLTKSKSTAKLPHDWKFVEEVPATCTTKGMKAHYQCTECEKYSEDKVTEFVSVRKLIIPAGHKWAEATCVAPKTCQGCGITEGSVSDHKWAAATCTAPKTCSVCKATSGAALGHKWTAATCTAPKTCSVCKTTSGAALGHKWEAATCTTAKTCSTCKATSGKALGHTYKNVTTKATLSKNGKVENKCSVCGNIAKTTTVYYPKTFKLSTTAYTYNGDARKPSVTVKDSKGNTLVKDTDYTVSYESGRKAPGKYTVKITFKGKYEGTKKLYFTIAPKKVSGVSASQTTTTITLKWKKQTGADGYRVYKYNSSTKKYEKLKDVTGTSYKISKLKAGTGYKYKVRAYTKDDGTIWGAYSSVFATATKPKAPSIKKLTTTKGKASLTWSNVSGESGYQVYYSSKKDSGYKKVDSYKVNVVKGSKSKLTSGKTYYFKVRAYKKTDSGTVYSSWSKVKSIKIK